MRKLAKEISSIMIEEQGTAKFIARLSDPYWFQAFGCVLAYDWHSSGVTTVVTGILKGALSPEEHGVAVRRQGEHHDPNIAAVGENSVSQQTIDDLTYTSRITAKVKIQPSGIKLYSCFCYQRREWAVIQQGMSDQDQKAGATTG
jgi:hypothetical protein